MFSLNALKIGVGYFLGGLGYIACLYAAYTTGADPVLQVALCVFGGVLGWVVGIAITPFDAGEKKQFSDFGKAISALISGFVVAKLDVIFESPLAKAAMADGELLLLRVLLFLTCLFIGMLFTFIARRYLQGTEGERRQQRERIISDVRAQLDKLSSFN